MHEVQRLEAADGHRIRLDVHLPDDRAFNRVAILLHGIFSNRSDSGLDVLADALAGAGFAALRFDLRGHGESTWSSTSFSPLGAMRDIDAAVKWCKMNSASICFVGSSFGGSLALNYMRANETIIPTRLALLSPVIDYRATFVRPELDWGKELFPVSRVQQLRDSGKARIRPHFVAGLDLYDQLLVVEPYRVLEDITVPTLLIHGDADDKVPVASVREHSTNFSTAVKYVEMPGLAHGFGNDEQSGQIIKQVVSWFGDAA